MNFQINTKDSEINKDQVEWQKSSEVPLHYNIFPSLNQKQTEELEEIMLPVNYHQGDLLFQEGSLSDGIYLICNGVVVYGKQLKGETGRSRIFKLLGPGDLIGEETVFGQDSKSRFGYARCIVDVDLVFLEKSRFINFLYHTPDAFHDMCDYLSSSLKEFEYKLLNEGFLTTDKRLAKLLIKIYNQRGTRKNAGHRVCLKLQRKVLAGILGVSEGSISRTLNKLEKNGFLSLKDEKICINDTKKLNNFI